MPALIAALVAAVLAVPALVAAPASAGGADAVLAPLPADLALAAESTGITPEGLAAFTVHVGNLGAGAAPAPARLRLSTAGELTVSAAGWTCRAVPSGVDPTRPQVDQECTQVLALAPGERSELRVTSAYLDPGAPLELHAYLVTELDPFRENDRGVATAPARAGAGLKALQVTLGSWGLLREGQSATTQVLIRNGSATPVPGPVVVQPQELGLPGARVSADGWSCEGVRCSWTEDVAPGAALPPLRLSATAPVDGTEVTAPIRVGLGDAGTYSSSGSVSSPRPDVVVSLEPADQGPLVPGRPTTLHLNVINGGGASAAAPSVRIVGTLPGEPGPFRLPRVQARGDGWVCSVTGWCRKLSPLAAGESSPLLLDVGATTEGRLGSLSVSVYVDPTPASGFDRRLDGRQTGFALPVVDRAGPARLDVNITDTPYPFTDRGRVFSVLTVSNHSTESVAGAVLQVTRSSDAATTGLSAPAGDGWTCRERTCWTDRTFAPGATSVLIAHGVVNDPGPPETFLRADLTWRLPAPGRASDLQRELVTGRGSDLVPALRVVPGESPHVEVLVRNQGGAPATAPTDVALHGAGTPSGDGWTCFPSDDSRRVGSYFGVSSRAGAVRVCRSTTPVLAGAALPPLSLLRDPSTDRDGQVIADVLSADDVVPFDNTAETTLELVPSSAGVSERIGLEAPVVTPALTPGPAEVDLQVVSRDGQSLAGPLAVRIMPTLTTTRIAGASGAGWACDDDGLCTRAETSVAVPVAPLTVLLASAPAGPLGTVLALQAVVTDPTSGDAAWVTIPYGDPVVAGGARVTAPTQPPEPATSPPPEAGTLRYAITTSPATEDPATGWSRVTTGTALRTTVIATTAEGAPVPSLRIGLALDGPLEQTGPREAVTGPDGTASFTSRSVSAGEAYLAFTVLRDEVMITTLAQRVTVLDPSTPPAPPPARAVARTLGTAGPLSPSTVAFDRDITSAGAVQLRTATGAQVPVSRVCGSATGAVVPCDGPARAIQLTPLNRLVPGGAYRVLVVEAPGVSAWSGSAFRAATTLQDRDITAYWPARTDPRAIGGSHRQATPGASFTTTFTGTAARWWYLRGPDLGVVRVTIDGRRIEDLNQHEAARRGRLARTYVGLAPGTHTMTITVLTRQGSVDAVSAPTSTCTSAVGCTASPAAAYALRVASRSGASGGTVVTDAGPGTWLHQGLVGTGVDAYVTTGPGLGVLEMRVDGRRIATVSLAAAGPGRRRLTSPALTPGAHTVTLVTIRGATEVDALVIR